MTHLPTDRLRPHLATYLRAIGIVPQSDDFCQCPNPMHADHAPYENAKVTPGGESVKCFVCAQPAWDAVAIEMMRSGSKFPDAARAVAGIVGVDLGGDETPAPSHLDKPKKPAAEKPTVIPVPADRAAAVFNLADVTRIASKKWGQPVQPMWAARNENREVEVVDVRFEKVDRGAADAGHPESEKGLDGSALPERVVKTVISYYWDGKELQHKNAPVVLFGRDRLASEPDAPVCFHEGAKCWHAAREVPGIVPLTWNRGVESVGYIDLAPVSGRVAFIYPDDDEPGYKAARKLAARLSSIAASVKICAPMVRGPGFDVVDALVCGKTPDEIGAWILEGPALEETPVEIPRNDLDAGPDHDGDRHRTGKKPQTAEGISGSGRPDEPRGPASDHGLPFRILGYSTGFGYFLDDHGYIIRYRLSSLTKNQLVNLAPIEFWSTDYPGGRGSADWDQAASDIIQLSKAQQFDPDTIRGRGAWSSKTGGICYHDGTVTHGEPDPALLYIKETRKDISLDGDQAHPDDRRRVLDTVAKMSFKTQADTVRTLGWAALAPFGGALSWRPSMILTGDSGSGKSTLIDRVIRPIVATPHFWSGIDSTSAGIRQEMGADAFPVIVDEAKGKDEASRARRAGIIGLMRQSATDDSPRVVKGTGTQDGTVKYTMRSMFLLSAVEEDTGSAEDENRLFVVNMEEGKTVDGAYWKQVSRELKAHVTPDICAGIRSFVWANLLVILDTAAVFRDVIQAHHVRDIRRAYADGLLFAAFWVVYRDEVPSESAFEQWLTAMYQAKPQEDKRNEADELVQVILDEVVPLQGDTRFKLPLREILRALSLGKIETPDEMPGWRDLVGREKANYMQTAKNAHVYLVGGEVAIKTKSDKFAGRFGQHYNRTVVRHPGYKGPGSVNGIGAVLVVAGLLFDVEAPF